MEYFFSKNFNDFELGKVDYFKCSFCGFSASKNHFEMSSDDWEKLNNDFHSISHYAEGNANNRNQRYFNQALMISLMHTQKIIPKGSWLDWGCGVGAVSKLLNDYFNIQLGTYDKYFKPEINEIDNSLIKERSFDFVLNTCVFEHVRDRETLDEIESFVKKGSGCFAVHTLVPEQIPQDANWMYLLPVHCAFHTNHSMGILMKQWGYQCSVYNENSKLWVFFQEEPNLVHEKVKILNKKIGWNYLHFKPGFMDYWK